MGDITDQLNSAFRDFNTDGVPSSGDHEVVKSDVRAVGPVIEDTVTSLVSPYSDAAHTSAQAAQFSSAVQNVMAAPPSAGLPYEVIGIAGGIGTGSGGTPGWYVGGVSGGPLGFQWSYQIGSGGALAQTRIDNPGIALTNAAPTLGLPSGGMSGATTPTATVDRIPTGRNFWAPNAASTQLLAYTNNAGALSQYPTTGAQLFISLNSGGGLQYLFQSGTVVINRYANTITTGSGGVYLLTKDGTVQVASSQTVALPTSTNASYVYVVAATGVIGVTGGAVPAGCYLLAILTPVGTENCFANAPGGNLSYTNSSNVNLVVGPTGTITPSVGSDLPTITNAPAGWIGINLSTGRVTTGSGTAYAVHSAGYKQITAGQSVAITGFSGATNLITIYVNMSTGAIGGIQSAAVPANCLAIAYIHGTLWPAATVPAGGNWPWAVTSAAGAAVITDPRLLGYKSPALIYSLGTWTLTMTSASAGNLVTNTTCYVDAPGQGLITVPAQTLAITATQATRIYVDAAGVLYATTGTIPAGAYWPLMMMPGTPGSGASIMALTTNAGNVRFVDSAGAQTYIGIPLTTNTTFSASAHRLVLPNDLWFVSGHVQPLYKGSITTISDGVLLGRTKVMLDTGMDQDSPYISIGDQTDIDPARLSASPVAVLSNTDSTSLYSIPLTAHIAPATAISGTSPKVLVIGDSLMELGGILALRNALAALGATPTFVGTYAVAQNPNPAGGNLAGEGRGSWSLRNFVGRDTSAGGNAITYAQGATTTHWQNPFMRVATSADLAANPSACFSFASNTYKNPSYAENPLLGTYYIFDFAAYLTACSVAVPDVVLIQPSTNDVNFAAAGGYTQAQMQTEAQQAHSIMVKSIRAAAPNCKIVVVSGRANNRRITLPIQWFNNSLPLFEAIQVGIKTLQATVTGLTCVGTYAHTSTEWGWPFTSTALGGNSAETVDTISDDLHYSTTSAQTIGKTRVARVEAAAVACALAGV